MENRYKALIIVGIIILVGFVSYDTYYYLSVTEKTIQVGYLPSNHHAALFVAQEKDMFENEGLTVQMVPFQSGAEIISSLENGQIDMGYCGIAPATEAIDQGADIKIVAAVNTEGSGLVVANNITFNNISDMKGLTVAIPSKGSVQDVLLSILLLQNNMTVKDIHLVEQEVPVMPPSLKNGKMDAYVAWEPYVSSVKSSQHGRIYMYSGDWWDNHPCCVVVSSTSFIEKKPIILNKFLKTHVEATNYLETNENESALIVADKLGTSRQDELEAFRHLEYVSKPNMTLIEDFYQFIKYQRELGYINGKINASDFDFSHLPN